MDEGLLLKCREKFTCKFPAALDVFDESVQKAQSLIDESLFDKYIQGANFLCSIGQGVEPVLAYLNYAPKVAHKLGGESLSIISDYGYVLARSPNKTALVPFIENLPSICVSFSEINQLSQFLKIIDEFIEGTRTEIHVHQSMHESPGLVPFLQNMPQLLSKLDLQGIANFVDYGAKNYNDAPDQQIEYFSLESQDARSIILRERKGTVFKNVEMKLYMCKESLWQDEALISSYSTSLNQIRTPEPYIDDDDEFIAVPDVFEDYKSNDGNVISGEDRYRAVLAHLMAHKKWSQKLMADNYAPQLRMLVSAFEDCRVDVLAMRHYPGLKKYFHGLHVYPQKGECKEGTESCLRYRTTRLSRALIDPGFNPEDGLIESFRVRFCELMADGKESSTAEMSKLATEYYIKSRVKSDSLPNVYFDNTEISYRDDNRYIWHYYEEYDEADEVLPNEYQSDDKLVSDDDSLPPRFYDEWDYNSQSYRPDWNTVYERLHPSANPVDIDNLVAKHAEMAKRLKRMIEILRPQNKTRVRFQEEGEELDLDIALRSLIELKSGQTPDLRINYSFKPDNRDIAVMLLVDSSESLNNKNEETGQTLLEISQEALALTAWTVDQLGDKFAIAGFNSNTRSEVRYQHIKGFSEKYNDEVKARIAAMEAGFSTRMGAAMRHASHYLKFQKAEKKLLLILTDGEPADLDAKDPQILIKDTKKAVEELQCEGVYTYCITLDRNADEYVKDIFGNHFTVIDHVSRLPEQLPKVFLDLTR